MTDEQTLTRPFTPTIGWDFGTAYELFISLHVLHNPDSYGIRASWAAGVRSRIPAAERKLLEEVYPLIGVPLRWIHNLPAPKDAISALWALKQIPASERVFKLYSLDEPYPEEKEDEKYRQIHEALTRIHRERAWITEDVDLFLKVFSKKFGPSMKRDVVERCLDWWSRPEELGEGLLSALHAYYQAFFEEEEKRLTPVLKAALERAQNLANTMPLDQLFVELSQGVQLGEEFRARKLVFAPAFWTTPLIFFERLEPDTQLVMFGARPADMSAIPGESLPEGLVRSLKALADPTRLKILYYLSHESLTPSELARRLQLRAPTVTHHLNELRLASLVELSMQHDEKRYKIRTQGLDATFSNLTTFLSGEVKE
ncbi:MAG: winged helix-turn-helix domain-containing protein [Chloroflexota bacterium]